MISIVSGSIAFVLVLIGLSVIRIEVSPAVLFTAFIFATINVLTGAWFVDRAMGKSNKSFFLMVFGSMFVRMFFLLALTLTVVLVFGVNVTEFVFVLFGFYVFYLILELKFLIDRINFIKKNNHQKTV
ncbi:MAG: hypothetical protein OZ913_08840 [Ignavibacteriaceae bacterium]|nr:hypothetical protein [Ignavibacteriaceae bacterium]